VGSAVAGVFTETASDGAIEATPVDGGVTAPTLTDLDIRRADVITAADPATKLIFGQRNPVKTGDYPWTDFDNNLIGIVQEWQFSPAASWPMQHWPSIRFDRNSGNPLLYDRYYSQRSVSNASALDVYVDLRTNMVVAIEPDFEAEITPGPNDPSFSPEVTE